MTELPQYKAVRYALYINVLGGVALGFGTFALIGGCLWGQVGLILAGISIVVLSIALYITSEIAKVIIDKLWDLDKNAIRRTRGYSGTT